MAHVYCPAAATLITPDLKPLGVFSCPYWLSPQLTIMFEYLFCICLEVGLECFLAGYLLGLGFDSINSFESAEL